MRGGRRLKKRNSLGHVAMVAVLKEAREKTKLTGREVSRRLQRPPNFCHRVESSERMLSMPEFIDYAKAVDADPIKLLRKIIKQLPK